MLTRLIYLLGASLAHRRVHLAARNHLLVLAAVRLLEAYVRRVANHQAVAHRLVQALQVAVADHHRVAHLLGASLARRRVHLAARNHLLVLAAVRLLVVTKIAAQVAHLLDLNHLVAVIKIAVQAVRILVVTKIAVRVALLLAVTKIAAQVARLLDLNHLVVVRTIVVRVAHLAARLLAATKIVVPAV